MNLWVSPPNPAAQKLRIGSVGFGVLGSLIPATGISGPSYLYNDLKPEYLTQEVRGEIVARPPGGKFFAYNDGSFVYQGPSTTFTYQLYVNGRPVGAVRTVSIGVGTQPSVRDPDALYTIDLIRRAMLLAKILSGGEQPKANEATDALAVLNIILDGWNVQPLTLWASENDQLLLKAGQGTYTIGRGGDWDVDRPSDVLSAYVNWMGFDQPAMKKLSQTEFDSIAVKRLDSSVPSAYCYISDFPLGVFKVWPVPQVDTAISIASSRLVQRIRSLYAQLIFPPGMYRALYFELAHELSLEYGSPLDASVLELKKKAMADYKRSNKVDARAVFDAGLGVADVVPTNIFTR